MNLFLRVSLYKRDSFLFANESSMTLVRPAWDESAENPKRKSGLLIFERKWLKNLKKFCIIYYKGVIICVIV